VEESIILKWSLKKQDWINQAGDMDQWPALVSTVMMLQVPSHPENDLTYSAGQDIKRLGSGYVPNTGNVFEL
jgi:hypothetical protein